MPTTVSISEPHLFIASFAILVAGIVLAFAKTPVGPAPGKYINRVTLLVCVFFSAAAFSFGLFVNAETLSWRNFATPLSNSLRMMHSGGTIPKLDNGGIPIQLFDAIVFYEQVIYLFAPVSTLIAIAQLLQEAGSFARMRRRSVLRDTFVLTPLNSRTLELAKDIQRCYKDRVPGQSRRANIVFAGVKAKGDEPLMDGVREQGCVTLEQPLEIVVERLLRTMGFCATVFARRIGGSLAGILHPGTSGEGKAPRVGRAYIMFDNDDESSNIARALSLQDQIGKVCDALEVQIFAVAQRPNANAHEPKTNENSATLRYIDWTYSLVQKTLSDYPLFLQSMQPPLPKDAAASNRALRSYLSWQRSMLIRDDRHVVVVGAGHVGTEFLMQAFSHSRIWGTAFTFDVLDSVPDPNNKTACLAQQLVRARAPELLDQALLGQEDSMRLTVNFHRCDVTQHEFEKFLDVRAETISYVFVCLGDDTLTTQAVLKASEVIERALVRRCATGPNAKQSRSSFLRRERPLVVGVVDSDNLAHTLTRTANAHGSQLQSVGSPSSMYTFGNMIATEPRNTDYERRQAYASRIHAKYRVFAYAKKLLGTNKDDLSCLPIDWRADFLREVSSQKPANSRASATHVAIERYNANCKKEREWLLRMEHGRWCTFTRAMGYCRATKKELCVYFGRRARPDSPYRNADALLHPYLVPFDDLARVDELVAELRQRAGLPPAESHMEKSERHLPVR